MAAVEKIIDSIKRRKIQEALDGLARPQSKDSFELGRLSGIQHGLAIAEQLVNEAIGENEDSKTTATRKR